MRHFRLAVLLGVLLLLARPAAGQDAVLPHVEAAGTGEANVVLIHGTQGDWTVWRSFMERNADRYTMLAVQLPGLAGYDALPAPEDDALDRTPWTDAVAGAVVDEIERRGMNRVYLIGHDLGAMIAMRLAIDHPALVAGVISVDAMPAYPLNLAGYTMTPAERMDAVSDGLLARIADTDPIAWRLRWKQIAGRQVENKTDSEHLSEIATKVDFYAWRRWIIENHVPDLREPLRDSGVPVLAAAAVNGGMLALMGSQVMVEEFWRLPFDDWEQGRVTFFENTRHYIFLDRPETFDAMVTRFVAGQPPLDYSYREPAPGADEPTP